MFSFNDSFLNDSSNYSFFVYSSNVFSIDSFNDISLNDSSNDSSSVYSFNDSSNVLSSIYSSNGSFDDSLNDGLYEYIL